MKNTRKRRQLRVEYKDGREQDYSFDKAYYSQLISPVDMQKHPYLVLCRDDIYYVRFNLDEVEMIHFFSQRCDL